jgi:hypothetical protein
MMQKLAAEDEITAIRGYCYGGGEVKGEKLKLKLKLT